LVADGYHRNNKQENTYVCGYSRRFWPALTPVRRFLVTSKDLLL
jgi:hypothetical protein